MHTLSANEPLSMQILAYDLRGGTGTVMSFGNQNRHPVVLEVGIRQALLQLPELSQQTSIGRCNVQSINIDPRDSNRLAFHLASGWSGETDHLDDMIGDSITGMCDRP